METRQFTSYGDAITAAIAWLKRQGADTLDEAYEARMGGFGMRTIDGSSGYRIEFDPRSGAHINLWSRKLQKAHFMFPGNEQDVRAKWRQLFWWDPKIKRRSSENPKI